jgi:hypothetical protein
MAQGTSGPDLDLVDDVVDAKDAPRIATDSNVRAAFMMLKH